MGQSHSETLWQLVCNKNMDTVLPTEGNAHFLSGALEDSWKTLLGADLALNLTEKWTTEFLNVDNKGKKNMNFTETMGNVIPFIFPVTPLKQTGICNDGK